MRAATPVPAEVLAERRRLGLDGFDEMWEGILHVVPAPSDEHQRLGGDLHALWHPVARAAGVQLRYEIGLYDPAVPEPTSYRQPDLAIFGDDVRVPRGIDGAADLVVEIRSPGDESFEKVPFYERMGVGEVLILDRDTKEVRRWRLDAGTLVEQEPDAEGWHRLAAIPSSLRSEAGGLVVRTIVGDTRI